MKKVVVVAKYFPPLANARSLQAGLFVKALAENNDVVVVTTQTNSIDKKARSTSYKVIRLGSPVVQDTYNNSKIQKIYRRLKKELGVTIGTSWSTAVTNELRDLVGKGYDNIISLSEPFDSHLAVFNFKNRDSINWACFYSDPWPISIMPQPYSNSSIPFLSFFQQYRSKRVLEAADTVFVTNKRVIPYLEQKLQVEIQNKTLITRHQALESSPKYKSTDTQPYLVHCGHLSRERVSKKFFKALIEQLVVFNASKIKLVGRVCQEMKSLIEKEAWGKKFILTGEVTQQEAMQHSLHSRAVLLIEANMPDSPFIPSKLAEYYALEVPIVCLTNKDSDVDLLMQTNPKGVAVYHSMEQEHMEHVIEKSFLINEKSDFCGEHDVFSKTQLQKTFMDFLK